MAKYKPTHENQMVMLPVFLEDQLVPGTLEHTIHRKEVTADSNYQFCKDEKLDAYIPDIQFCKCDPRYAEQERFKEEQKTPRLFSTADFTYAESAQVYRCTNGKELKCHARNQHNRYRTYDVYHARPEDCGACSV